MMLPLFIPPFCKVERGLLGPNPVLDGRRPGYSLDESPAHRRHGCHEGANCASGAIWGLVSCSRILRHVAQSHPGEPGI